MTAKRSNKVSHSLALVPNTRMRVLKRAIQIIMYMVQTFMVHAFLHWTERGLDNLSLWSFAVQHSVWVYNHVPNARSDLTPLELITRDCHVWGRLVFVLEAKLQNDQKLPKCN